MHSEAVQSHGHCVCYNVAGTLVLDTVMYRSLLSCIESVQHSFKLTHEAHKLSLLNIILYCHTALMTYFILHVDVGSTLNQLPNYLQVTILNCKQQSSYLPPL